MLVLLFKAEFNVLEKIFLAERQRTHSALTLIPNTISSSDSLPESQSNRRRKTLNTKKRKLLVYSRQRIRPFCIAIPCTQTAKQFAAAWNWEWLSVRLESHWGGNHTSCCNEQRKSLKDPERWINRDNRKSWSWNHTETREEDRSIKYHYMALCLPPILQPTVTLTP